MAEPDPGRLERVGTLGTGIVSGDPPVELVASFFFFTRRGIPFGGLSSVAVVVASGLASDPQVIQHPCFLKLSFMNHTVKKKINAKNAGMTSIPAVTETPINSQSNHKIPVTQTPRIP